MCVGCGTKFSSGLVFHLTIQNPQFRFWVTDVLRFRDHIDCLRHVVDSFGSSKINSINRSGRVFCLRYVLVILVGLELDWVPFCFPSQQQQVSPALSSFRFWFRRCYFVKRFIFISHADNRFYFQAPGMKTGTGVYPCNFDDSFFLRFGFIFVRSLFCIFFLRHTYTWALQLRRKIFSYL